MGEWLVAFEDIGIGVHSEAGDKFPCSLIFMGIDANVDFVESTNDDVKLKHSQLIFKQSGNLHLWTSVLTFGTTLDNDISHCSFILISYFLYSKITSFSF